MFKIIIFLSCMLISVLMSAQVKELAMDIRGRDCRGGSGLCNIQQQNPDNAAKKIYTYTKFDSNKISFEINRQDLSISEQITFFGTEYKNIKSVDEINFKQENDYIFDREMFIFLELDTLNSLIKSGFYPVTIENDKVKVTFTLSSYK